MERQILFAKVHFLTLRTPELSFIFTPYRWRTRETHGIPYSAHKGRTTKGKVSRWESPDTAEEDPGRLPTNQNLTRGSGANFCRTLDSTTTVR